MPESLLPLLVSGLCYSVAKKPLLKDLNLQIDHDGTSVILGPNGAGKSLLVRLLHGLIPPESGSINWNGERLGLSIRRSQAIVFQKPVLLRRSVAANIQFVLRHASTGHAKSCQQILEEVDLYEQRQQPARLLSGGEQQRLALARALATFPQVLFLDEPTASVDPTSTLQIENLLNRVSQAGVKLILVTHDIGQAHRLASDVIFMHRGRILEHTEANDFFQQPRSAEAKAFLHGELVI